MADQIEISRNTAYRWVKKLEERGGSIRENFTNNTSVDILKLEQKRVSNLVLTMELEIDSLGKAFRPSLKTPEIPPRCYAPRGNLRRRRHRRDPIGRRGQRKTASFKHQGRP
ncbi:hypothetical protein AKJ37_06960 [candidate division MSBL1 archaeon SCGC-AAA259I09]|uniref:Uncharacterized protein n=1 Tax=candidate division MSBL1 archaeon SCGC-AAA259I09 TaxID=1698267 RepID=A0A133UM90_9EURY|nr:hypothetical protein AKJ37_06960 [candidate division MSBL1 archaeon SCGC-AAA259I09]